MPNGLKIKGLRRNDEAIKNGCWYYKTNFMNRHFHSVTIKQAIMPNNNFKNV